jgi:PKD repeat protein
LRWDISAIPATAIIDSASFQLEVTNISSGGYDCYALLQDWTQEEANWNQAASGVPWGSPGAGSASDRGINLLCTVTAASTGSTTVQFTVSGLALLQSWVSGASDNYGLIITSASNNDGADFHSSESATAMSRPKLDVVYSTPVIPPNLPPVSGFGESCTDLHCNFTDASTDSDGDVVSWSWDFGDTTGSTLQDPSHTFAAAQTYTVSLTVTDDDGAGNIHSHTVTVEAPTGPVDNTAVADVLGQGTVSGTYLNTRFDDGVTQSIRERESGGKKSSRHSLSKHTWRVDLPPVNMATVLVNAWSSGSNDGDSFVFAWSTDNSQFFDLFEIDSTDTAFTRSAVITAALNGPVYIRVTDTDRSSGNRALDTVFIDQLIIRTEAATGSPPDAPGGLSAVSAGSDSVSLAWNDNSPDESGFEIDISTDGSNFSSVGSVGADVSSFLDTGLSAATNYWFRVRAYNGAGFSSWSTSAMTQTDPGSGSDISLSLSGAKNRGKHVITLSWQDASGATVDIFRDGGFLLNTSNDGPYVDNTGNNGGLSYTYQVCETETSFNCSQVESITF